MELEFLISGKIRSGVMEWQPLTGNSCVCSEFHLIRFARVDNINCTYRYDGNSAIGHRLYKEVNIARANNRMKGKASKNLPATSSQWEILATNLKGFQKVVVSLAFLLFNCREF